MDRPMPPRPAGPRTHADPWFEHLVAEGRRVAVQAELGAVADAAEPRTEPRLARPQGPRPVPGQPQPAPAVEDQRSWHRPSNAYRTRTRRLRYGRHRGPGARWPPVADSNRRAPPRAPCFTRPAPKSLRPLRIDQCGGWFRGQSSFRESWAAGGDTNGPREGRVEDRGPPPRGVVADR